MSAAVTYESVLKEMFERQGGGQIDDEDEESGHYDGYQYQEDDSWGEGADSSVAVRDQEAEEGRQHLGDRQAASRDLRGEEQADQQQQNHAVEELQKVSGCQSSRCVGPCRQRLI